MGELKSSPSTMQAAPRAQETSSAESTTNSTSRSRSAKVRPLHRSERSVRAQGASQCALAGQDDEPRVEQVDQARDPHYRGM